MIQHVTTIGALERDDLSLEEKPHLAQPHLVIGLGDIGRRAIGELRRTLDRPYGGRASPSIPMDYLSIDLESAPHAPAVVPSSLTHDEGGPHFTLDMESLRDFGSHLPDEMRQWLSRYEAATAIGSDTAADRRRLGSLLLMAKAEQLQDWLDRHAGALLPPGGAARLVVHVVGYLAGGMGGGALTQLLVQLRHNQAVAERCHIIFYGVLPGEDRASGSGPVAVDAGAAPTKLADADPQRRVGSFEEEETGFQGLCDEILVIAPPIGTGQRQRDVRRLPEALAMTMRQRLFMPVSPAPVLPAEDRARGRSVVAVAPVVLGTAGDDAEEALSVGLLQAALYQLIYAHWSPGRGFVAEARPFDYTDHVTRAEVQWAWLLSAEHLIQSAPILDADGDGGRWKPLAEEWRGGNAALFEQLEGQQRKDWLDILTRRWEQYFREEFRGVGVSVFYTGRQGLRRDMARAVRCKVEQSLFEGWRDGQMGLACARGMVDALIDQQRDRLASVENRVATIRVAEEACRVRTVAAHQKWARLSSSRRGRGEAVALVNDYAITLQELFVNRTRAEGWLFGKAFLPMIIEELEDLRRVLDRMLGLCLHRALGVDLMLDGLSARMEEGEANRDFVQHLFDRRKLRHFARDMLIGEAPQQSHCQRARQILTERATPRDEFHTMAQWVESNNWMAPIAALCRDQIVGAGGLWTASVRTILDSSIYRGLQASTDGDFGRLREMAATLISRAISLLPETAQRGASTRIHVLLPRDEGHEVLIQTLKSAFSFSRPHDISIVDAEDCRDSLSVLAAAVPFSISEVEFLDHLDQNCRDYAMLALRAGGDDGDEKAVFPLDDPSSASLTAAFLLIGLPLSLVVERVPAGGGRLGRLWLTPKDGSEVEDKPIAIADDLLGAPRQMNPASARLLEDNVRRTLAAFPGDSEQLVSAIVDWVAKIRGLCRDDPFDETYRLYVEAGKLAVCLVRGRAGKALAND